MKKILLLTAIVLLSLQAIRIASNGGLLRSVDETIDFARCQALFGPVGAEDISIDPISQLAFIAADDRRISFQDKNVGSYQNGGLWVLDLSKPDSQAIQLETKLSGPFHPHGLALRFSDEASEDKGRAIELYVVNHLDLTKSEIDVFKILPNGELKLRRRISYPELMTPNDLVVSGRDQFFASNDHGNPRHSLMEALEDYLGLPLASVSYFDGEQGHIIIDGLRYTNGLALSDDKTTLYIAETTARQISRYTRSPIDGRWGLKDTIDIDSGPDNLEWDGQGNLLTGAHPKMFEFVGHMASAENLSPSEVVRIDVSGEKMRYESVYLNSGEALSGSSVAAQFNNQMLIGSVFEPHFLRCSMSENK